MIRSAISPRLAIRTFLNMFRPGTESTALLDLEELLAELDGLAVLDQDLDDRAVDLALDLVHELHRFDDAEHGAGPDLRADLGEGLRARRGRAVERAHQRRSDRD